MACALDRADQMRVEVSAILDPKKRSELGQFMTPRPVPTYMAGLFDRVPKIVHLLDADAGVDALTAAFVHQACQSADRPEGIDVAAFRVTSVLARRLELTLEVCAGECAASGVTFTYRLSYPGSIGRK